ncbi:MULTISPECIES: hypothetical protein [Aequorivita]|uniref:Uncharacterized protein n=1 Tax=Aequorivita iocasae TaxID=2803865 RepID=A0ABX7DRV7_9FLAO|nr:MULTISPECIES: hypothetical protein [Aequorivita]QQX76492.1 hypothetical protein JK629_14380 [Aequorivita iocasae]UCA55964.1 hypothetical protein LDL78_14450 [Aequorivita sp. F7]
MEKSKIDEILGSLGFGLPENKIEIKAFDESFRNYQFEADETKINSEEILKNLRPKIKPTNIDFHRRTVLAAEIVFKLHKENTLGHLKLQKLIYLCQHSTQMNLHTNFLKQAMGPYDNRLMRSLDKKFRENQWFTFSSNDYLKYQPLEKVGGHREWYERYFSNELSDIDFIIEKFRKFRTRNVELIATVFACWKEIIEEKQLLNDDILIKKFYAWHPDKSKYQRQEILDTIDWMNNEGFYPSSN